MPSPRLILGIDASRSRHPQPTGVERYSTEIISALLELCTKDELRLYTPQKISSFPEKNQRVLRFPRFWTLARLSLEMLLHKPDVLFVPAHVLPFFAPKRSFVMIHDLAFEKVPEAYSSSQRRYLRWSTRRALKKCKQVLVPSSAVQLDLERLYGAKSESILVVPHGPLPLKIPEQKPKAFKEPVFFYLGRLETKKNLSTLAKAFKLVQKKHPKARLVLAGRPGYGWETFGPDLTKQPGVELPGFMSEKAVVRHFLSSTAFMFPSLEEGFGFPLLQAFQAGCPVICSDIPVLKEVAGGAGIFIKPTDVEGFAKAMIKLIEEPESSSVLTLKGKKRLQDFSWKKAGQTLADLFHTP